MDHEQIALRPSRELRAWQKLAFETWVSGGHRGIAKVVTGGGKTVFAECCLTDFLNRTPEGRVLIVVPTLSLLDQWWVGLQEDLGLTDADMASYSGNGKPSSPSRVNLMVLNTARRWAPRLSDNAESMLIVDECHRSGSHVNAKALQGRHAASLGISATPEREGDSGFDEVLVPALGPVFFEYGYNQASRDGVIAPFDLVNVEVALSDSEQAAYDAITARVAREMGESSGGDEDTIKSALLRRAQVVGQARMRVPVAVRLVERFRGSRALVFHERVEAAEEICSLLISRGHAATIYHSRLEAAVRRDNLRQYRRGVFDVLVTCRALDEGMDVPETSLAVIASSTGSSRQRIQRLGRALRPSGRKTHATVMTIFATEKERERLQREQTDLVEARSVVWEKAQVADS